MKSIFQKLLLSVCITVTVLSASVHADAVASDPTSIGVGARVLGMGRAYVGLADDLSGIFLNPAALSSISSLQLTTMQGKFINEYDYMNLGAAVPTAMGTFGVGFVGSGISFTIPSSEVITYNNNERVLLLSFGRGGPALSLGATLKLYSYDLSGPGVTDGAAAGKNVDLGLTYRLNSRVKFGAAAQNALPASMGGKISWKNGVEETLPSSVKLGTSLGLLPNLLLNVDNDLFLSGLNRQSLLHCGLEWSPVELMDLRAGLDQDIGGKGLANNLTAGVGIYLREFRFDYAYHVYDGISDNDTHYFSLSYGMGKAIGKTKERKPALATKIVAFKDVPEDYWARAYIEKAVELGFMQGYPDGTFHPEEKTCRIDFLEKLLMIGKIPTAEPVAIPFVDILPDSPIAPYVQAGYNANIAIGYTDKRFYPQRLTSRAEGVVMIVRLSKMTLPGRLDEKPYMDVPARYWAIGEISAAKQNNMLEFVLKNFYPEKDLTRAEMAATLVNSPLGTKGMQDDQRHWH